jgi:type II secretory pathway pseudopilin PulG
LRRGVTLIEMLLVVVTMAVILGATAGATVTAVNHQQRATASRTVRTRDALFEDRLRNLISGAYLSTVTTETSSFFVGGTGSGDDSSSLQSSGPQLIFTTVGERIPSELLESTDDFETLNERFGPRGGMVEVAISQTPVGNAPTQQGLFIRKQVPADGDLTQGGMESVLDADIDTINFEFWDGLQWITEWDTQSSNTPRLPAAVRITYRRQNEDQDRFLIVRLRHSDVTPDNPLTQEAGA